MELVAAKRSKEDVKNEENALFTELYNKWKGPDKCSDETYKSIPRFYFKVCSSIQFEADIILYCPSNLCIIIFYLCIFLTLLLVLDMVMYFVVMISLFCSVSARIEQVFNLHMIIFYFIVIIYNIFLFKFSNTKITLCFFQITLL